jgi:hypothetical protein
MRTDTINEKGFFQRLDTDDPDLRVLDSTLSVDLGSIALHVERKHPQINERAAQFMEERAPLEPWAYRQKLAPFTHLTRARRIDTGSDRRIGCWLSDFASTHCALAALSRRHKGGCQWRPGLSHRRFLTRRNRRPNAIL